MIGFDEVEKEYFCDLNCYCCGGWAKQTCPMLGGNARMLSAVVTCLATGILWTKLGSPTGLWEKHFMLDIHNMPALKDFPVYPDETVN